MKLLFISDNTTDDYIKYYLDKVKLIIYPGKFI